MTPMGCGIIRIPPPDPDVNASNEAIDNLVELSGEFFEEVVVFDYAFADDDRVTCVPMKKPQVHSILKGIPMNLYYQLRLTRAIWGQRRNLDVTMWHSGGFSLLVPLLLTKLLGIDVLLFVLGEPRVGYRNMMIGGFVKTRLVPKMLFLLEVFSFVIANRIVVFNEGILDYSVLRSFENKVVQFRFNYQEPVDVTIEKSNKTVVYLGRLCELKGTDRFARAVQRLLDRNTVELEEVLFVGTGPTRERWETTFEQMDRADDVVTFTGWLSHDEAMDCLAEASVFVLPSRSEGLPKTLVEAMSRGVVPVVTPVGNMSEVVTDGHDGILLQDASPVSIADVVERLLNDGGLARELSANSVDTAVEEFSYETARGDLEQILRDLQYLDDGSRTHC